MAKQQYRISGELQWASNSGNALLAIVNRNASGKKVTLRSLEVTPVTSTTTATAGTASAAAATQVTLARATVAGGIAVEPTKADTNATWPSTVRVLKQATVASASTLRRIAVLKQLNQASLSWFARQRPGRWGALAAQARKDSALEGTVVAAGEAVALYASTLNNSVPVRVSATIIRNGSPKRTFAVSYFTTLIGQDVAAFALVNDAGSGETLVLRDICIEETGTFDSPYLQLVPVGGLVEAQASFPLTVLKMDTAHPDPATFIDVRGDCPMLPSGVPEDAFALSSSGSPKGFNYLKTKDFLGPTYRTLFPEYVAHRPGAMPDAITARSDKHSDILIRGSGGIVIREGEGIALVSASETAAGATAAVGLSGWSCFEFAATIELEPATVPTVSIGGMVEDSRWRVERVSDSSIVATGVADVTGAASFLYEPEDTPLDLRLKVRKASAAPFYKPVELTFELTSAGVSIPVSQVSDS